jgi:glycosyltransferase involved in cell wall biosynthesis
MNPLRIAVLVDLPRETAAGGHVKYWERIADAAVREGLPVDLTIYFSGTGKENEILSPQVRFRFLAPVFSTAQLKFLPYVPAHTDLAPFHPQLARELPDYDVIHTTDGFFAFARTAERIARWYHIPLVTSFHTDTPAYTELFTRATIENLFGRKVGDWIVNTLRVPARARAAKETRLRKHLRLCSAILAMRPEDKAFAAQAVSAASILPMHLGVDKTLFTPQRQDRAGVLADYGIARDSFVALFVGRVDRGKNMHVLARACAAALAQGVPLHLLVAGEGPLSDEVKALLGDKATLPGTVTPQELARLYASVDCLAISSEIEIGGMIGCEALAAGCPVLVSKDSGMAQLFGDTSAMQQVASGVEAWTKALVDLARDGSREVAMHDAASRFRRDSLAGWDDVLKRDFMPAWIKVAQQRGKADVRQTYIDPCRSS